MVPVNCHSEFIHTQFNRLARHFILYVNIYHWFCQVRAFEGFRTVLWISHSSSQINVLFITSEWRKWKENNTNSMSTKSGPINFVCKKRSMLQTWYKYLSEWFSIWYSKSPFWEFIQQTVKKHIMAQHKWIHLKCM